MAEPIRTAFRVLGVIWPIALCLSLAAAAQSFPERTGRVVDAAAMLDPYTAAELDRELAGFEEKTTDQVVLVTVPGLGGQDIADYAAQLARHWGLAQAGKDKDVLLLVARDDDKQHIEVGHGLANILTDERAEAIVANVIVPAFKAHDYQRGLRRGVQAIFAALEEGTLPTWIAPAPPTLFERHYMIFVAAALVLIPLALLFRDHLSTMWFLRPTSLLSALLTMALVVRMNRGIERRSNGGDKASGGASRPERRVKRSGGGGVRPVRRSHGRGPLSR